MELWNYEVMELWIFDYYSYFHPICYLCLSGDQLNEYINYLINYHGDNSRR